MSSCQKRSNDEETREEVKKLREAEVFTSSKNFLRDVVFNMCTLEGISGHIDTAFEVDRGKIIAQVLRDIVKELEEDDG